MIVGDLYVSSELFMIIQPILITSRCLGLFPVRYRKSGVQYKLNWSIYYGIYSFVLLIFLRLYKWTTRSLYTLWGNAKTASVFALYLFFSASCLAGLLCDLSMDDKESLRMTNKKTRFVTCCDIIIIIVIVTFSCVTLPFKVRKFWKIIEYLNQSDRFIPASTTTKFRRSSLYFIITVLSLVIIIFICDIAMWFNTLMGRSKHPVSYIKHYFCFYLLYMIVIMKEVFFWHVIFLIKIKISSLNKCLKILKQKGKWHVGRALSKSGDVITFKENIGELETNIISNMSSSSLAQYIVSLTKFQDKIYEAVEEINGSAEFGVHILMLSCLLHLIVTSYFLLVELIANGNPLYVSLQLIWVLGHIGRVLIIVEPCQLCINEHQITSHLICGLLTCDLPEDVKKAMTVFSLHLNYCKITFSSCGFFKINRSLLTSISGAITTYLVILFQFNNN